MILSKKYSVSIANLFCDEPRIDSGADVARYNYFSSKTPGERIPPFHTMWIDLTRSTDKLMAGIHRDTRKDIRRAERDGAVAEVFRFPEPETVAEFCEAYNASVAVKGLPPLYNADMAYLMDSGALLLSCVRANGGPVLAWHAYYQGERRCILTYSVSTHRAARGIPGQMIGRANRYLHWCDLVYFHDNGFELMDMGGWYGGRKASDLLRVNKFKEEFGGKVMDSFSSLQRLSLKGCGALNMLKLKRAGNRTLKILRRVSALSAQPPCLDNHSAAASFQHALAPEQFRATAPARNAVPAFA